MPNQFSRTELLLGKDALNVLNRKRVAVFGIGGVGGYICEALIRSGIRFFDLVDSDRIDISNLNRQIHATIKNIGAYKTEAMKERMLSINPDADITVHNCFFLPGNSYDLDFGKYDYVADATDTVAAKLEIIKKCKSAKVGVISAMGAGNKIDPERFKVSDIYETKVCPLAKVMRRELRRLEIDSLKVVYSDEEPVRSHLNGSNNRETESQNADRPECGAGKAGAPGSNAVCPAVCGLIMAGEIIKDLTRGVRD